MVTLKTTEPALNAPLDAQLVPFFLLVTLVLMLEETQPITAHVLLVTSMQVLINVPPAIQVALLAQVPPDAPAVILNCSESSTTLFVSVKKDTLNLFSKMELKSVPSAQLNARPVLKAPLNAQAATHLSTELKVMTHWDTELVSARRDIMLLLTEDVFNPTVNQTNGAHNVKPILPCVSNAKPT